MAELLTFRRILLTIALAVASAAAAVAQTAPAGGSPPTPPATPPPAWHGSLSLGLSAAAGVQAQRSIQVQSSLSRLFAHGGRFVANASHDYQRVTFPSDTPLSDRSSLAVGEDEHPTEHTVVIVRTMYLRDSLLQIDHRFEQMAGYGLQLHDKDKRAIEFQLVPGFSLYKEDLAYADPAGWKPAYGFYQKFAGTFDEVWSVQNSFRFRHDFTDAKRSIESAASLEGRVTKAIALQLQYQYNYESVVPPDYPNYLSAFGAGLKFKF